MAGSFKRTQLMLRREDHSPGGFVRMEHVSGRCMVEISAPGINEEARAILFRPEGGGMQSLGPLRKGAASFSITEAEAEGCTQAAIVFGDKVLLAGGEGADFPTMRKRLAKASAANAAPAEERRSVLTAAQEATLPIQKEEAMDDALLAAAMTKAMGEDIADGWNLTPVNTPGMPGQLEGQYVRDGEVVGTLYGIAGVYAPEPPPGLSGFTWDHGYWVYIQGDAPGVHEL